MLKQLRCLIFLTGSSFPHPFLASAFYTSRLSSMSTSHSTMAKSPLAAINSQEIQFITNTWCPYAQKAWIALEASNCEYQMQEVKLYGSGGKPDWFWELNPKGTVPIVVVKDKIGKTVLADSEDILDAVMDGRIKGDGNMSIYTEGSTISKWREIISKQLVPVGKSAVLGGSKTKLQSLLKEIDSHVVGPYLTGDKFTVADAAAFPFIWRLNNEYGLGSDDTKQLHAWLELCSKDESVKKTIPTQGWWWWW